MSEMNLSESSSGHQQQQAPQQPMSNQQQSIENQIIQVQISHPGSGQMHSQGPQVTNLQSPSITDSSQGISNNFMTRNGGPAQQMVDWTGRGHVQVIQQPVQNPTYMQPIYNAQGQLLVPTNITLCPENMNQPLQIISARKPFQAGPMPKMLCTMPRQHLIQEQSTVVPGYLTVRTSKNNQTPFIPQPQSQTNIIQQKKSGQIQKIWVKTDLSGENTEQTTSQQENAPSSNLVTSQTNQEARTQAQTIMQPQIINPCQQQRAVSQTVQFAPWQTNFSTIGLPQGLTWTQGSPVIISNPQHGETRAFMQNAQPSSFPKCNQVTSQQIINPNQIVELGENIQNRAPVAKKLYKILPNSTGLRNIRPANINTQFRHTATKTPQGLLQNGSKISIKNVCSMPIKGTTQKSDAESQTWTSHILHAKIANNFNLAGPSHYQSLSTDKIIIPRSVSQQLHIHTQNTQNMFQDQNQSGQIAVSIENLALGDLRSMPELSLNLKQLSTQSVQTQAQELISQPLQLILPDTDKQETSHKRISYPENREIETETEWVSDSSPELIMDDTRSESVLSADEDSHETEFPTSTEVPENTPTKTVPSQSQIPTHIADEIIIDESSEPFPRKMNGAFRRTPDLSEEPSIKRSCFLQARPKKTRGEQVSTEQVHTEQAQAEQELEDKTRGENSPQETEKNENNSGDVIVDKTAANVNVVNSVQSVENAINPQIWTIAQVRNFIQNLPGCSRYADDFAGHEIDGRSLLLLDLDLLMTSMSMSLGPAVKIIDSINKIRPPVEDSQN